jgi:hypothetical protein
MQEDKYYRGYRLSVNVTHGTVNIYSGPEFVSIADSVAAAKDLIDAWMWAR